MSNVQSYNALIDRFKAFASGHFILKRFSHGQIEVSDLEKFGEYPFMHVVPSNVTYAKGMKTFSFQIVLADMPRDKEDKTEYQREVLSDLQRIAEDLIAEITNHRVLFGDLITVNNVSLEPFLEEFQHTLTGWTISLDLLVPYYWDACSIPAEWNDMFESSTGGIGSILTFIDSITRDENGNVSLVNDEAEPSPNYYYGTNDEGVRGWYLLTDEVGLTCETIGDCQTIIDIEAAIDALEEEILLKADITSISAVGFSNDYNDLDNKPTIPDVSGFVPYTGATTDVDLGTHDIYTNKVYLLDEANDNHGSLHYSDGDFHIEDADGHKLLVIEDGFMQLHLTDTIQSNLFTTSLTQTRDHYLPNQSGTIALTSDIPSIAGLVPTTRTLTINGTTQDLSANRTFTIATGLTVGTTPITSGTVGRVLFEGTGNVLQESANLTWNNSTNVFGITGQIQVSTDVRLGATGILYWAGRAWIESTSSGNIRLTDSTNSSFDRLQFGGSTTAFPALKRSGAALCVVDASGTSLSNFLIGTTTDAGYKLDVNGTARVTGAGSTGTTFGLTVRNSSGTLGLTVRDDGTVYNRFMNTTQLSQDGAGNAGYIQGNFCIGAVAYAGASAVLDLRSTTRGFLPPRMTTTQKNAISSPAAGLVVYDTTLNKLCVYTTTWETITSV
jgi:hypothetical protein